MKKIYKGIDAINSNIVAIFLLLIILFFIRGCGSPEAAQLRILNDSVLKTNSLLQEVINK